MVLGSALAPLEGLARPIEIRATHEKIFYNLDNRKEHHQTDTEKTTLTKIVPQIDEAHIKDYLTKIRNPDRHHHDDIVLDEKGQKASYFSSKAFAKAAKNSRSRQFLCLRF